MCMLCLAANFSHITALLSKVTAASVFDKHNNTSCDKNNKIKIIEHIDLLWLNGYDKSSRVQFLSLATCRNRLAAKFQKSLI